MNYLIAYDVSDDARRDKVAATLESYGWRVQKSVFEASLDPIRLARLVAEVERDLTGAETEASVRVYPLCASCLGAAFGFGAVSPGSGREPWLVV